MTGHRPGEHGGVPLPDDEAEEAAGPEHLADPGERERRVDHLEHAVAEHHVGGAGADDVDEVGDVTLQAADLEVDLLGATGQRRERVGARVDDAHPVSGLGQPDGEAARPTAEVHDVPRAAGEGDLEGVPDDGGPHRTALLARGHALNTR